MMRTWMIVAGCLLLSTFAIGEVLYKVEVRNKPESSKGELYSRIYALELAVNQLQRKVFELEYRTGGTVIVPLPGTTPSPDKSAWITCYIRTPFDGTYSATEPTETAARAGALEKCAGKANQMYCHESSVKCGK